jgi:hypothetical protein
MGETFGGAAFSESYKHARFLEWYQQGKPTSQEFWLRITPDEDGRRPSKGYITRWISDWQEKAAKLDAEVEEVIIESVVAEKVEMLRRHAKDAKEIQTISLIYLREHKDELTAHSAVRLLQLGIEIERQSVGIPQALEKMSKLDDKSLLSEITSILQDSEVTIELLEPINDDE